MAVQAFLTHVDNQLGAASMTVSSVLPVANAVTPRTRNWHGRGDLAITGTYTGAEGGSIEVEIIDIDASDHALVTAPEFLGVGNGRLTAATVATAQQVTVTLADLGEQLTAASINLGPVVVRARQPGTTGNAITLSIDNSGLSYTLANFSTLRELHTGDELLTGPEYDWATEVMGTDDVVPVSAKRIRLGDDDVTIYRQAKQFNGKGWDYRFFPALRRDISAGTPVYFVTGSRTVTVSDGVSTEVFAGIQTIHDLIRAIQTGSALLVVEGLVAEDHGPEGVATLEFDLRTTAYAEPSAGSGSRYALRFVDVTVGSGASTELVRAKCFAIARDEHPDAGLGHELWSLSGTVSGDLGVLATGVAYSHPAGKFGLKIPAQYPEGWGSKRGKLAVQSVRAATSVEVVNLYTGTEASDQTITLTWRVPGEDGQPPVGGACDSRGMASASVNPSRLGLTDLPATSGGGSASSAGELGAERYVDDFYFQPAETRHNLAVAPYGAYRISGSTTKPGAVMLSTNQFVPIELNVYGATGSLLTEGVDYVLLPNGNPGGFPDGSTWIKPLTTAFFAEESVSDTPVPLVLDATLGDDHWVPAPDFIALTGTFYPAMDVAGGWSKSLLGSSIPNYTGTKAALSYTNQVHLVCAGSGAVSATLAESYWEVKGSTGTAYDRAGANGVYYSAVSGVDTHEFAFELHCRCPQFLKSGDSITLAIKDARWPATYQVGDVLYLPIVAAMPLRLAGGHDGDNVQTWLVSSSTQGALPAYALDADSPSAYSAAGVSFLITPGTVPFAEGDKYSFGVAGGHFRWRWAGASWSAAAPITLAAVDLGAGLTLQFATGSSPMFVAGDRAEFAVWQPGAARHVADPDRNVWRWAGSSAQLDWEWATPMLLSAIALAHVRVPESASVEVTMSSNGVDFEPGPALCWSADRRHALGWLASPQAVRAVRLSVSDAAGGEIGWVFAGPAWRATYSARVTQSRHYKMAGGAEARGAGQTCLAEVAAWEVDWSKGSLSASEAYGLVARISDSKRRDNAPLVFLPNVMRADEFGLVTASDEVVMDDVFGEQPKQGDLRRYAIKLQLEALPIEVDAND